jgi:hypothetical protein
MQSKVVSNPSTALEVKLEHSWLFLDSESYRARSTSNIVDMINLDLLPTLSSVMYILNIAHIMLLGREIGYTSMNLPPSFSPDLHPYKRTRPQAHCNAYRNHSIHAAGEVGGKVCSIEDDTPPSINRVTAHIHARNDNSPKAVFFVAEDVVGPREECRLTSVYTAGPVVHNKVD